MDYYKKWITIDAVLCGVNIAVVLSNPVIISLIINGSSAIFALGMAFWQAENYMESRKNTASKGDV